MLCDPDSRVNFPMAEALAFGTLALHRGVFPAGPAVEKYEGSSSKPDVGLNKGAYSVITSFPLLYYLSPIPPFDRIFEEIGHEGDIGLDKYTFLAIFPPMLLPVSPFHLFFLSRVTIIGSAGGSHGSALRFTTSCKGYRPMQE